MPIINEGQSRFRPLPARPSEVLSSDEDKTRKLNFAQDELEAGGVHSFRQIPEEFSSRLNSQEVANCDANYFDIFNLEDDQRARLIEEIRKWNGLVRIFVHPYFALTELSSDDQLSRQRRIDQQLQKILAKDSSERPPVIIMESYETINDLFQYIKEANIGDIYIAPTFTGTSQPYPSKESTRKPLNEEPQSDNWKIFIGLLHSLGVRKVIAGGQYIAVNELHRTEDSEQRYFECLGNAVNNLQPEFDVELSNISNMTRTEVGQENMK